MFNKHIHLSKTLEILQKYAVKIKNKIELIQDQKNERSKIHLNNQTRWSSQFLMLKSFHKSYLKDAFPTENPFPISFEVIETYQILYPAYQFNLIMQEKNSTVADVIPTLMTMFSKWKRFEVICEYKTLCNFLVPALKLKFDELKSKVYLDAALLNTKMVKHCYYGPDCENIRSFAFDSID